MRRVLTSGNWPLSFAGKWRRSNWPRLINRLHLTAFTHRHLKSFHSYYKDNNWLPIIRVCCMFIVRFLFSNVITFVRYIIMAIAIFLIFFNNAFQISILFTGNPFKCCHGLSLHWYLLNELLSVDFVEIGLPISSLCLLCYKTMTSERIIDYGLSI